MKITRWLPTFLAFPPAGLIAMGVVGSVDGVTSAALAGVLAGSIIGTGQWLALRGIGFGTAWIGATAAAFASGSAVAAAITGAGTDDGSLMITGLIVGASVGGAQALLAGGGRILAAAWSGVCAGSWSLGRLVTTAAGIDVDRGWAVFGLSGAVVATILTGLALRRLLAAERPAVVATAAVGS